MVSNNTIIEICNFNSLVVCCKNANKTLQNYNNISRKLSHIKQMLSKNFCDML